MQLGKYKPLNDFEKSTGVSKVYVVLGLGALYFFLVRSAACLRLLFILIDLRSSSTSEQTSSSIQLDLQSQPTTVFPHYSLLEAPTIHNGSRTGSSMLSSMSLKAPSTPSIGSVCIICITSSSV